MKRGGLVENIIRSVPENLSINLDLSKALFIFSYNDESKVSPILLDRMYKIQTA